MGRLQKLEKELAEKDKTNAALNKKLEKKILDAAHDYRNQAIGIFDQENSFRSSNSNSLRKDGQDSARRLKKILSKDHPEYSELVTFKINDS